MRSEWADAFLDNPDIKIVNCSWGLSEFPLEEVKENETIAHYCERTGLTGSQQERDILSPPGKKKLFVWAAGNEGYPMPTIAFNLAHWGEGRAVATNVITVTALEDTKYLEKEEGRIRGLNILHGAVNGASFSEDGTLAAPGSNIVSANADYANTGEIDVASSGTSSAAPHVAGAEPKLRCRYTGNQANTYDMRNAQDKTHFVLSIGGEAEVAKGWTVGGDASFQRGSHDKDWSCSVTVKRMW